jgi:hypothetical protein
VPTAGAWANRGHGRRWRKTSKHLDQRAASEFGADAISRHLDQPEAHARAGDVRFGNNMTPHISEEFATRLIDWSPFMIVGNTMPPRDPDEDEEDEDEDGQDRADEPPVVREPDED